MYALARLLLINNIIKMSNILKKSFKSENLTIVRTITTFSLISNLLLSAFKFIVGILGSSQVVIADAVHSLSDSATDLIIIFGVKIWTAPPDEKHPYGHQKIEALVSSIIGLTLFAVAIGIGYDAISDFHNIKPDNSKSALWLAITAPFISIIAKEFLFRWNYKVGKQIKSSALIANAWEHRSDAISSVAAVLAIGAIIIDPRLAFLDNVGAIIVAVFIIKVAWDIISPAISEFIDSGASEKTKKEILDIVINIDKVKDTHAIRTRKTGDSIFLDLHVLVDGNMSVTESHGITEKIQTQLMAKIPEIIDVVVHIEPYKNRK